MLYECHCLATGWEGFPDSMSRLLPHLGFVLVYTLWGINLVSMKVGGQEWDPFVFNGMRYLSLILLMWPIVLIHMRLKKQKIRMERKDFLLICGLGLLSAVGMEALLSYALQYSNAANGAVLGRAFMPIVTAIIALALKEIRFTWGVLVGVPLGFAGVIIIMLSGGLHFSAETAKGDLLLLARSLMGVLYLLGMNQLVRKYPLPLLLTLEMTAGAVALLPVVIWNVDAAFLTAMSQAGWISLVYTTIFATWVGFYVHNWSLGKLGPFRSSVYGYMLPITAAVAGAIILSEKLSWNQYIGGVLILAAMYFVQHDRIQLARKTAKEKAVMTQSGESVSS